MNTGMRARRQGDPEHIRAGRVPNVPVSAKSPTGDARDVTASLHKGTEFA
jgi:hypothetical protein